MPLRRLVAALGVSFAMATEPLMLIAGRQASDGAQISPSVTASGRVVAANGTGASAVSLRLRNVDTGAVAGQVQSDASGAFSFSVSTSGTYVVEAMDPEGRVQSVSQPVNITNSPVTVNMTLPSNRRAVSAWLIIATAAAGAGLTAWAVGPGNQPVPVSPEQ